MEHVTFECIDWLEVQATLDRSLKLLSTGAHKKKTLESLLQILRTCGDYRIQHSVIQRLLKNSDVIAYKNWFSKIWFAGMGSTMEAFLALFEQDLIDTRPFLNAYNKETGHSLVHSFKCHWALSNGQLMKPRPEKLFWLDVNYGSQCFTLNIETDIVPNTFFTIKPSNLRTNVMVRDWQSGYHLICFNSEKDELIVQTDSLTSLQLDSIDRFLKGVSSVCLAYV